MFTVERGRTVELRFPAPLSRMPCTCGHHFRQLEALARTGGTAPAWIGSTIFFADPAREPSRGTNPSSGSIAMRDGHGAPACGRFLFKWKRAVTPGNRLRAINAHDWVVFLNGPYTLPFVMALTPNARGLHAGRMGGMQRDASSDSACSPPLPGTTTGVPASFTCSNGRLGRI